MINYNIGQTNANPPYLKESIMKTKQRKGDPPPYFKAFKLKIPIDNRCFNYHIIKYTNVVWLVIVSRNISLNQM